MLLSRKQVVDMLDRFDNPESYLDEDEAQLIDPRYLVGIAELSDLFGVARTTASMWHIRRDTNGFPEAVATLRTGPIFDVTECVEWYARYNPSRKNRPGRMPLRVGGTYQPAG